MLPSARSHSRGYAIFPHQVAGHRFEEGKQGILIDSDGKLLKPIQEPPRGERELQFYQYVFREDVSDSVILKLRSFLPTFFGVKVVHSQGVPTQDFGSHIILKDLTKHFCEPCILDVKIGRCVTDHLATRTKRERGQRKYPEQHLFGLRILGMKVFKKDKKCSKFYDKSFGKNLKTHQEVLEGFKEYFCQEDHGQAHILKILERLMELKTWFLEQRTFRLFSSSILIIYEGYPERLVGKHLIQPDHLLNSIQQHTCAELTSSSQQCNNSFVGRHRLCTAKDQEHLLRVPHISVHLVDFAHAYISSYSEPDVNYLYGLDSLIQFLKELVTHENIATNEQSLK